MKAIAFLRQVRQLDEQIRQLDIEIAALREVYGSLRSPWPDGLPHGSGAQSPVEREAVKVADQIQELLTKQIRLRGKMYLKRAEIVETIGKIPDSQIQKILHAKYIERRYNKTIAKEMSYSEEHISRLHKRGLLMIEEVLNGKQA